MSWPSGIAEVQAMLAVAELQRVSPSHDAATAALAAAGKHLASARSVAGTDPDGAYALLYDAARKSLAALLQAQGLRPRTKGGHVAIERAVTSQFTQPPPRDAFRPFGRLRRNRNQIEYDEISAITGADVKADLELATILL